MIRPFLILIFFLLLGFFAFSQEENKKDSVELATPVDSIQNDLKKKGVVVDVAKVERKPINPLAPSKAAFYSAVLPGLGQIYNKRYWKVPLVYGALATGVYVYSINNTQYNDARDAFKRRLAGFTDDQFYPINGVITPGNPRISDAALEDAQERFQRDRDLALLVTIVLYALNVIDANVDAHLKQYNVDEELALEIKPYLELNPINSNPNYGLTMVIKF